MARAFQTISAAIILVLSFAAPVAAGPFEDAAAAYSKGDYATAFRLFGSLANQGDAIAQTNLGLMYLKGQGVPQNYAEAVKWFRLAADQGDAIAQTNLGLMYFKGEGVPQDYVRAHMWFNLAASKGEKNTAKFRDGAASLMTPAQIAEAQKLAREWKRKQ